MTFTTSRRWRGLLAAGFSLAAVLAVSAQAPPAGETADAAEEEAAPEINDVDSKDVDELFSAIPDPLLFKRALEIPPALSEIHLKDAEQQREALKRNFDEWRQNHEQVDDVLIVGIEI